MTNESPVRPGSLPTAEPGPAEPRSSRTITAERSLERLCRKQARERLGPGADEAAVARVAKQIYEGGRAVPEPPETPVQRWQREQAAQETREALARSQR